MAEKEFVSCVMRGIYRFGNKCENWLVVLLEVRDGLKYVVELEISKIALMLTHVPPMYCKDHDGYGGIRDAAPD